MRPANRKALSPSVAPVVGTATAVISATYKTMISKCVKPKYDEQGNNELILLSKILITIKTVAWHYIETNFPFRTSRQSCCALAMTD